MFWPSSGRPAAGAGTCSAVRKDKNLFRNFTACVSVFESRVRWAKWIFLWLQIGFIALATTYNAKQIPLAVWVRTSSQYLLGMSACRSQCKRSYQKWNLDHVFEKKVWSAAMLPLKESHIALLCWPLAGTHFLLSPSSVLELSVVVLVQRPARPENCYDQCVCVCVFAVETPPSRLCQLVIIAPANDIFSLHSVFLTTLLSLSRSCTSLGRSGTHVSTVCCRVYSPEREQSRMYCTRSFSAISFIFLQPQTRGGFLYGDDSCFIIFIGRRAAWRGRELDHSGAPRCKKKKS